MEKSRQKILVIDALMGSGKTTWAISDIDNHPDDNVLYITPYVDETKRIARSVKREMKMPQFRDGKKKYDDLCCLLESGEDIASTHALFMRLDSNCKDAIKQGEYTLYLDETITAIEPYELAHKNDIDYLVDKKSISIGNDGFINWLEHDELDTRYNPIKIMSQNRSLFYVNNKLLMWRYPPEIFKLFKKVIIMTYLFEASILSYYFKFNDIPYELRTIKSDDDGVRVLSEYCKPDLSEYKRKIHIYKERDINENFGATKKTALSSSWFKSSGNADKIKVLRNNIYNYFRNKVNAKTNQIMWTSFKMVEQKLKGKGYTNGFVSCNCRATNDYSDTCYLAYCLNVYPHVGVSQFFTQHGIDIDADSYALSEMIQWIWRSKIRMGGEIWIYIPSKRMRFLLCDWLDGRFQ